MTTQRFGVKHLIFVLILGAPVVNIFIFRNNWLFSGPKDYFKAALSIFLIFGFILAEWLIVSRFFKRFEKERFFYASIVLSPFAFLFFWDPQLCLLPNIIPISIVLLSQFCFWGILSEDLKFSHFLENYRAKIFVILVLYIITFVVIAIRQYNHFSNFNPKDLSIYNQTFWNTIHGKVFQNSAYGSNFSCHNSPFLFILVPFYRVFAHPLTLMVLKTILLALSAIPVYLILKGTLSRKAILPLLMAYLFYPLLICQNITAPHEITYAPFFILFTFYFYMKEKFLPYALFLLISLSIKEQAALISVMFGLYSLCAKKSARWVIFPIFIGLVWGIFSLWLINHFQQIYKSHIDAAWFIVDVKRRFLQNKDQYLRSFVTALAGSNIGQWYGLHQVFLYFGCLGIFLPFFSFISLLGSPEMIIALISNRPGVLGVPWHYTIIFSCFLFIGAVFGIRKISVWPGIKKLPFSKEKAQVLLAFFVFSLVLMHIYTWVGFLRINKTGYYVSVIKEALRPVPANAYITVPKEIAPYVSSRKDYGILEPHKKEYGDYILFDKDTQLKEWPENISNSYEMLFSKSEIRLFKRKGA